MAHGSPRINICHKCKQYILVSRFSQDPICPDCNVKSKQTTKDEICKKYNLGWLSYQWQLGFNSWSKI